MMNRFSLATDSSTSTPSSPTTSSPPASPTAAVLRRHPPNPFTPTINSNYNRQPPSSHGDQKPDQTGQKHQHQHQYQHQHHPILPCAVLPLMVLRRRPSAVDMALSEERSRCDDDAIERQGLGLMEPRPVDVDVEMHAHLARNSANTSTDQAQGQQERSSSPLLVQQPRFVMGGIFEVMEGRA